MKILLINPTARNMISTEVPSLVSEERGHNPPLGILYVAGYIEKNTTHKVEVLDADLLGLSDHDVKDEIVRRKPDVIGITAMTFTLIDCINLSKLIREVDPTIKIVYGGLHVNIFPNETINLPGVDFLVLGEGELPFADLLNNIESPEKLKNIKGLVFKDNNKIVNTGPRDLIMDLDSLPFPARHLTPYKKYSSLLAKRSPVTTMLTSRGCPYKCLFCDRPHLGKVFRSRSAKNVVNEMQECVEMGIKEFLIYDDTFTINRQRVLDICHLIKERKLDIGWDIRARVNTVDRELLHELRSAGCERIHYGVESGNQQVLNTLRKGITIEQVQTAFKLTKKEGIDTLAYFMIGSPGETKETIMQSINFAKKLKPGFVHFSVTTPFPSTDLYKLGFENGMITEDYWREFAKNPTKDFKPQLWEENLSREELISFLTLAYKSFYVRPSYAFQKLMRVRSFGELTRKARAGLKLFKLKRV
ncbi:MAG: radical SAM protein [bacterium]|nr:radical SAM protein [bacterium]